MVMMISTSQEAWETLEASFASQSSARVMQICTTLSKIKKHDFPNADTFFNKVKSLADVLRSIGQSLRPEEFNQFLLAGLDGDYDALADRISAHDPLPIRDVYSQLLNTEQRVEARRAELGADIHSANYTSRATGGCAPTYQPQPPALLQQWISQGNSAPGGRPQGSALPPAPRQQGQQGGQQGGLAQTSVSGHRFYVSFVDAYSHFTWLYLLKHKSDVFVVFLQFQQHVERLLKKNIIHVQSDWGGEYLKLNKFFADIVISHRVSCPHTHQQNGTAERKHRHIVETGLTLLAHVSVPFWFWSDVFLTACFLINRLPSRVIDMQTPIERLFGNTRLYTL
jgi:hypothetical protein